MALDFIAFAGTQLQEVLIIVGGALSYLYGPGFLEHHLKPVAARFQEVLDALDRYDLLRRLGLA